MCMHTDHTVLYIHIHSTSQKSLNKCPTSGHILRLRLPTHWTQFHLRSSSDIRLHLRSPACVYVRVRMHSHLPPVSAYVHISVYTSVSACICVRLRLHSSAFVYVKKMKHPDTFRCNVSLHLDASFIRGHFIERHRQMYRLKLVQIYKWKHLCNYKNGKWMVLYLVIS